MVAAAISQIRIYPLQIPMRRSVKHAAAERSTADPVVVALETSTGIVGHGEAVARSYVTGEDAASVVNSIQSVLVPHLLIVHPQSFPDALEAADALPWRDSQGRPIAAARAAVETAMIDLYARFFNRPASDLVGWLGVTGLGPPGSIESIRFSGVLPASGPNETIRTLRKMWWGGLRHFKLKVGDDEDHPRMEAVVKYLGRSLTRGRCSLRIDANGAWDEDQAIDHLEAWRSVPLAGIEEPLRRDCADRLLAVHDLTDAPIIHDESLVSADDADRLINQGVADGFNIRVSKCGGLLPSLKLAAMARRRDILIQLGCMVGETSILSAAGLRFLEWVRGVTFAEGCFGRFVLSDDVLAKDLRFGYAGRPPRLSATGLTVLPDPEQLRRLCPTAPISIHL